MALPFGACASAPPQVLTLSAPGFAIHEPGPNTPRIAVRTIEVAEHLRGEGIAVRRGGGRPRPIAGFCWLEPLDLGVARVLGQRLTLRSGVAAGFEGVRTDYEVGVKVLACEGDRVDGGGTTRFVAEIELRVAGGGDVVARQTFTAKPQTWDGENGEQLARGLGQATGQLADAVFALAPAR